MPGPKENYQDFNNMQEIDIIQGFKQKHLFISDKGVNSVVYLMDCMDGMKQMPENYFSLAIVDPPYGIGQNWTKDKHAKFYAHRNDFNDTIPNQEYFNLLFNVSLNQIIWGANYYWNFLPPSNNLIFWDKQKDAELQHGSAGEIAWTNITKFPLIKVTLPWNGFVACEKSGKVHPHQKPIKLYEWLISKYLMGGGILDTHLGSGSSRIAAHKAGVPFMGFEKDEKYFKDSVKRFEQHSRQLTIF